MKIVSTFEKLPTNLKTLFLCILDALVVFISYYAAITFEEMPFSFKEAAIQNTVLAVVIMYIFSLNLVGVYKGIIKYKIIDAIVKALIIIIIEY